MDISGLVKNIAPAALGAMASGMGGSGNDEEKTGLQKALPMVAGVALPLLMNKFGKKDDEEEKEESVSDERLKNIFGDNEDAIKVFANLNAIKFTYNDKAKELDPTGDKGVDNDLHYGIKAQDLEKSPLTSAAVTEDEQGNKLVDTKELTAANSAVISEICKRLLIIENILGIKVV